MQSIFDRVLRHGPSLFVMRAIFAAIVADGLLLGFILLRRWYRKRYFAKRDARVFELRQKWDDLISVKIPYETWRNKAFDRRIVEEIALDAFEAAGPAESARLLKFLRNSGLIEKRIFEARRLHGWRRRRSLVALGRTRAPEGIPALSEGLRDSNLETRLAALRGLGRIGSSEAAEEILNWVAEYGLKVPELPLQNALITSGRERPQVLIPFLKQASPRVRQLLARVISEVAAPFMQEDLIELADDAIPELRAAAARSMGHAHRLHAVDVLLELAKDPVWFVRLRAAVALGELGGKEAIPALVNLLRDANRLVRMRAAEGLIGSLSDQSQIFEQVVATRDRYGLHAYLAALDNLSARNELERSIESNDFLKEARRAVLLNTLKSGKLPETSDETRFPDSAELAARP
jgi:HEAT repeat protein